MTASVALASPAALVASLPYLLGFAPHESVIVVWLSGARVILTQRLDVPDDPADPAWAHAVLAHSAVDRADRAVAALVSTRSDTDALGAVLRGLLTAADITVLDIVQTWGDRWRSLVCEDRECCPVEGRPLDEETRTAVAAEFAWAGVAPFPGREALVRALARDDVRSAAVCRRLPLTVTDLEPWRDASIAAATDVFLCLEGDIDAATAAEVIGAMADVRVRDTVLWEASSWSPDQLQRALVAAELLVRCAPRGWLAPVATVYAAMAWLTGDGARASIALDRVREEQPGYSLARLIGLAISGGMPPESWRDSLASLSREVCRHGSPDLPRRPA